MKNATLRQLVIFEAAARHQHYTRAALELGMTQPAVSIQIRQLEDNLGVALFEQIGRRVHLTEAGQLLRRHCRAINNELAQAQTALDRLKGVQDGELRIAIGATAKYFVPTLLAEFQRRHPGIVVDLYIANRDLLLGQIEDNERDLVMLGAPPQDPGLVAEPFLADPLVAIAAPGHPLAELASVGVAQLAQERLLTREHGSSTRSLIEQFFADHGVEPTVSLVVNSNEAIKRGVLAGLGVAIVPQQSIALELEVGRLVVLDVASLPLQRSWYLVHRKEKRFSCVAEAFKTFVLQNACDYVGALTATGNGPAAGAQTGSRGKLERTP